MYALMNTNKARPKVFEKSKLALVANKEAHKRCWSEANVLQTGLNTVFRNYKESTHMSGSSPDQSTHLDFHYCSRNQKTTIPSSVDYL
jgi:hypothetical protein